MRPTKILNFNFRDIVIHVYHIYDLLKIDDGKFVASVSSTKRFCDLLKWWGVGKMLVNCSGGFFFFWLYTGIEEMQQGIFVLVFSMRCCLFAV
jgi:hypothetical protein